MKLGKTGWVRLALLSGTAALTLLALIAGLGLRLNGQAHAATTNVNVGQTNGGGGSADEYNSAAITIPEGDTVDFDWYDGVHDVTAYDEAVPGTPDWQSPLMTSAATYSQTFSTAGVVTYYCTIHASRADAAPGAVDANIAAGEMVGKVTVEAAAADTPTPTDAPPTATPTDTPVSATATPTDVPPTATPTVEPPTETPSEATATSAPPTATATEEPVEATPAATETSEPATATPTNTPLDATVTAVPPTATEEPASTSEPTATEEPASTSEPTATEEPASTSEPTATEEPSATPMPRTFNVEAGNEWFGDAGNQSGADEITIRAGDTVQWNIVEGVHTVYECGDNWNRANGCADAVWSSDILQTGDIISRRFSAAGTYYYLCTLHPLTMRGVIAVEGNAPPNAVTPTAPSTGAPIAPPNPVAPPGAPTTPSTGNPGVSSPPPNSNLPVALANSGYGPLSQESARPDSPLGRAVMITAAAVALLAAALIWKEVAWSIRN